MVKPVATWFIIAAQALVTTSAQFVGDYVATTSSLSIRASVSDEFLVWQFDGRGEQPVSVEIGYPVFKDEGDYTVYYPNFGRFERLMTNAFPEVQMQDGELTVLAEYGLTAFTTLLEGEKVFFLRRALPLVPGTYVYDGDDSFKLILTISPTDVFLNFECADADYASFIRDVAESCPGSDLPTGGTPSFYLFSATPERVYLHLQG
ncbi:hypothetical protein FOZ60_015494, partial [Perkinsus olseni]